MTHFYAGDRTSAGIVCNSDVVSSSTIPNFSLTVFATEALYGAFDAFTDSFTSTCPDACGSITYSIVRISGTPPTLFLIDTTR